MEKIQVKTYTLAPGPRYTKEGRNSGEEFRDRYLLPAVKKAIKGETDKVEVDLDGTAGYGSPFLEETFGGLVRVTKLPIQKLQSLISFVSNEDSRLISRITKYMANASNTL